MRGFPKHFNTKEDVSICQTLFPVETAVKLREIIAAKDVWVEASRLDEKQISDFKEDATHRLIVQQTGAVKDYIVQTLQEDQNCKLFRLGLTAEEAQIAVGSLVDAGSAEVI